MKKSVYSLIIPLMGLIITTSSCDDFFGQVPDDVISIEDVFQRKNYSEEYLANIYNYIPDESHRTSPVPWDPCSDDLDVTYDRDGYHSYLINIGNWNPSSNYYNFWPAYYKGVRSATYFINNIGNNRELLMLDNGEKLITQYTAEARFLRAYLYYHLLRQYGPFVIVGENVVSTDLDKEDPQLRKERSSYDECVEYIVNELDKAIPDLPEHFSKQTDPSTYGRATQMVCRAVKSRVLLLAASPQFNGNTQYANFKNKDGKQLVNQTYDPQKWKKAAEAAHDIIKTGLLDLYRVNDASGKLDPHASCRDLFLVPWNCEVIFSRNSNNLVHWERSATPRMASGYQSMGVTQQLVDAFEMAPGYTYQEDGFSTTESQFYPKGTYNMYTNREPRFYVNVTFNGGYWINTSGGKRVVELYYNGNSGKNGTWDYPRPGYIARKNVSPSYDYNISPYPKRAFLIMRYAEVLLNYVEALNEYDPGNPDILKYLNLIRERAGVNAIPEGAAEMQNKIRHERRVELCLENLRYFDTRRWLIAEKTDGGAFYGMNVNAGISLQDPSYYKRTVFEYRVFKKEYYLFPIPQSEINKDPMIVQNPGW